MTGPDALSYRDVADKLSKAMRRQINYVDAPDDAVRQALLGFGMGQWLVDALVDLYQDYRRSGTGGFAAKGHRHSQPPDRPAGADARRAAGRGARQG